MFFTVNQDWKVEHLSFLTSYLHMLSWCYQPFELLRCTVLSMTLLAVKVILWFLIQMLRFDTFYMSGKVMDLIPLS